jgi:hypothetical protein
MSSNQSKKLLLIRPKIPGDEFTNKFSFPASDFKAKAQGKGWQVTELQCSYTDRNTVQDTIIKEKPDFIIHYDHGGAFKLYGQEYNERDPSQGIILDPSNIGCLGKAVVSTVSCSSALGLGPSAVATNTRTEKAYLGYDVPIACEYEYTKYFIRAANAANDALLAGKTFQDAKDIGYKQYTVEINKLLTLNDPTYINFLAAILMLIDRDHLRLIGDGTRVHAYT